MKTRFWVACLANLVRFLTPSDLLRKISKKQRPLMLIRSMKRYAKNLEAKSIAAVKTTESGRIYDVDNNY